MSAQGVFNAVETYLNGLKLDDLGNARAEIALALAQAIDDAADATSGAVAQAVPSMARELRETLDVIRDSVGANDPFLDGIFGDEADQQ